MQVVDASIVIAALVPAARLGDFAAAAIKADDNVAPELLDVEVLNALRGMVRRSELSEPAARVIVHSMGALSVVRRPHLTLVPRIWELRDNLTAYDAACVALAEALRCPLITSDARIASAAGIRCEVQVVGT